MKNGFVIAPIRERRRQMLGMDIEFVNSAELFYFVGEYYDTEQIAWIRDDKRAVVPRVSTAFVYEGLPRAITEIREYKGKMVAVTYALIDEVLYVESADAKPGTLCGTQVVYNNRPYRLITPTVFYPV